MIKITEPHRKIHYNIGIVGLENQAPTAGRHLALPPADSGLIMSSSLSTPLEPKLPSQQLEPDAHGQAALLLTESLLHSLVENKLLTNANAVEIIATAEEVKVEVAVAAGESEGRMVESLNLLSKMSASFEADLPADL